MNDRYLRRLSTVAALACLFTGGLACAQDATKFPTRTLRMVVPFAPGGASDFVGRILQPRFTEEFGQQLVIDNRSGAAGNIGVEVAARAAPDGHTFLLGNVGTMAINPGLYPSFPFQPLRDLIPITEVVDVPSIMVAHPSFPPKSVKEFVEYAKANVGKVNFGSPGPGSANRLEMESFMRVVGIQMTHIPYKGGAGPAVIGLMGNETQVMFVTLSSAVNFVKANRLKAFAITAPQRLPVLPEVPTMPESGYPALKSGSWQGIFVPKGTPAPIVQKLFATSVKVMEHPDVKKRMGDGGVDIVVSKSPADFVEFVKSETNRFGSIIKQANIVAD